MEITIKPHHFLDIIKLYGSGINIFVPDEKMNHDFYKIANMIIQDQHTIVHLTTGSDDICRPCKQCENGQCKDTLDTISNFKSKELYNHLLDTRLIETMNLDCSIKYEAWDLCSIMMKYHNKINFIWNEESSAITEKRHQLFVKGAKKYLLIE